MTAGIPKLTTLESEALLGEVNVSDGHPRMALTAGQRAIIDDLSALFEQALARPFDEIEAAAHRAFLHGIGQLHAPLGTGRLVSCYSSSIALDIVARALSERTSHVALVHPTFDNIPDLLKARGLTLLPLAEDAVADGCARLPREAGAVFLVSPNNPTGWVLSQPSLAGLAAECARTGRVLVMDTSFRGQDERAQYDTYATLDAAGVEWTVVEDTGKLWPVQELKAGFLAWGGQSTLKLRDAFDDMLLTVSPFVLLLLTRLAQDAAAGGYHELHQLISTNRQLLAEAVSPAGLTLTDPRSRISVARLTLPAWAGTAPDLYHALAARGVHTLPCGAFHWADPVAGQRYLRIALSRPPAQVEVAARRLAEVVAERCGAQQVGAGG